MNSLSAPLLVAYLRYTTDGLSIPFFSLVMNVSRTVSLSKNLPKNSMSKLYPDWLLGGSRNTTLSTTESELQRLSRSHEITIIRYEASPPQCDSFHQRCYET